jgi:phospholipid transport system substrate-binding protein
MRFALATTLMTGLLTAGLTTPFAAPAAAAPAAPTPPAGPPAAASGPPAAASGQPAAASGQPAAASAPAKAKKAGTAKAPAAKTTTAKTGPAPSGEAPAEGTAPSAPPPADSSPMSELKRANAQLKKLMGNRKPSWSPEAEAKNAEIRKIVGSFLDFEELAKRSLARHWGGFTAKQRADFVKTLRELVERNYVGQFYGQPDYELKLEKEQKTGNEATVDGVLHATTKGKKVTMVLQYKLVYKAGHWVVFDVITDDLSLLENYRAEFNKIIAKESPDALLARMKKKLAEKASN